MKALWQRRVAGAVFGFGALMGLVAAAPSALPICARAKAWVEENRESLPRTLAELSKYPLSYRKAIYAAHSQPVRVNLWREHFQAVLSQQALSDSQRAVVTFALANAHRYVAGERSKSAVKELEAQVRATFSEALGSEVFGTLGPPDAIAAKEPAPVYTAAMVPLAGRSLYSLTAARINSWRGKPAHPDCECSVESSWCGALTCHRASSSTCELNNGCGTVFAYPCDGICY